MSASPFIEIICRSWHIRPLREVPVAENSTSLHSRYGFQSQISQILSRKSRRLQTCSACFWRMPRISPQEHCRKNIAARKYNQQSRPFDAAFDVVSPYAFASLHHMLLHFAHALLRDPKFGFEWGEKKRFLCL